MIEAIIIHPIFAVLTGWIAWNVLLFSMEKDKFDAEQKEFPLLAYVERTWDNWLVSFVFIPVLLYIGYKGLSLNPFDEHPIAWTDLYYLFSGFAPELVKYLINRWKNKSK